MLSAQRVRPGLYGRCGCPDGQPIVNGRCLPPPPPACPPGVTAPNGQVLPDGKPMINGQCPPPPPLCPDGSKPVGPPGFRNVRSRRIARTVRR